MAGFRFFVCARVFGVTGFVVESVYLVRHFLSLSFRIQWLLFSPEAEFLLSLVPDAKAFSGSSCMGLCSCISLLCVWRRTHQFKCLNGLVIKRFDTVCGGGGCAQPAPGHSINHLQFGQALFLSDVAHAHAQTLGIHTRIWTRGRRTDTHTNRYK